MKKAYNFNEPIETMYKQIEDAVEFAADAGFPFRNQQVLQTAYLILEKTGQFYVDLKHWDELVAAAKTWNHFKTCSYIVNGVKMQFSNYWIA